MMKIIAKTSAQGGHVDTAVRRSDLPPVPARRPARFTRRSPLARFLTIGSLSALVIFAAACTDQFDALNTPDDRLVAEELDVNLLGQAFAQSQYRGMYGLNWQFQISQALFADLYAQYFATTAENFDSDQFVEVGGWADLAWSSFYGDAAPQIHLVETRTAEEGLDVLNAVARIWKVQLFHRISDYWGPIIYSSFGNGERSVPYDSQEDIYRDFFTTLADAIAVLEQNRGASAFGSNDQIYNGDVGQWITFANSLRLRLAMRVRYVEPGLARDEAEAAVAGGVMEDNSDNAEVLTTPNSRNPYTTITDWGEFRMSSAMESVLNGYEDPRMPLYFSPAVEGDHDADGIPYEGMRNGLPRTQKGSGLNDRYSDMGVDWLNDNRGGSNPPIRVMSAAEVSFLRAEGALLGWNMQGDAETFYNGGIRLSLSEERLGGAVDIDAYINSDNTPVAPQDDWNSPALSDIPVRFDSGASMERQLEQIITQKWLALYPDAMEAWAEYRRTGFPRLYPIIESANPDVSEDGVFRRLTFVDSEFNTNREAVQAAVSLLGSGGDANTTRLWWDAK